MRYLFIAVLFLLPLAGCAGGGAGNTDDESRSMNAIEYWMWHRITVCMERTDIEPFASMEFEEPRIIVTDEPCNTSSLSGCARGPDNIVEFNSANYFSDENATPLNIEEFVRQFKHIILFQAEGAADYAEEGPWFNGELPCDNGAFNGVDICSVSVVDCDNPLAPLFDEP